jgi:hypothetical protein
VFKKEKISMNYILSMLRKEVISAEKSCLLVGSLMLTLAGLEQGLFLKAMLTLCGVFSIYRSLRIRIDSLCTKNNLLK